VVLNGLTTGTTLPLTIKYVKGKGKNITVRGGGGP
jgi:hypothetical protein